MNLDNLKNSLFSGPVNNTVYMIYCYLRDNNLDAAKHLYHWDGDKVGVYSKEVKELLGCRLHNLIGCDKPYCS